MQHSTHDSLRVGEDLFFLCRGVSGIGASPGLYYCSGHGWTEGLHIVLDHSHRAVEVGVVLPGKAPDKER